jgi:hypothetical protein
MMRLSEDYLSLFINERNGHGIVPGSASNERIVNG